MKFLKKIPLKIKEATGVFRKEGFKGVTKRYGKKFFIAFFCFYLVRDLILYVALPLLAAKGVISLSK